MIQIDAPIVQEIVIVSEHKHKDHKKPGHDHDDHEGGPFTTQDDNLPDVSTNADSGGGGTKNPPPPGG